MGHEIGKVFLFNFKLFFWRFSCQKRGVFLDRFTEKQDSFWRQILLPLVLAFAILMLFAFLKEIWEHGRHEMIGCM
jgi:hypothetical protein